MNKAEITQAHQIIQAHIHRTPVLTSSYLDELSQAKLHFKCENLQKIGAFKMRGATYALSQLNASERQRGVITHSSGNHAQAVALAAKLLGIKAVVVMPENAPKVKVEAVKAYGAEVHFCEANIQARQEAVERIQAKNHALFIPPYDHPHIITGQATCAKELIEEVPDLDAIICPVGGGGLLAGTLLSVQHFGNNLPVYAGEPEGANDAIRSLKSGQREVNANTDTIADGLLTNLGELNFQIIQSAVKDIIEVTDLEIKTAMRFIWERMKIIVEPSCAVPLAAILKQKELFKGQKVGVILSGGNVDLDAYFNSL